MRLKVYMAVFNPRSAGIPFEASIDSALGFADEVHVLDGASTDGSLRTLLALKVLAKDKLILHRREFDRTEPAIDGMQKQHCRRLAITDPSDLLWQQDADEVVQPRDYEKVRALCAQLPPDVDVMSLPVIELWGDERTVRTDRHCWKWRLSRASAPVEHGINVNARRFDDRTGKVYAAKGMSDGCEYIISDFRHPRFLDFYPHSSFAGEEFELLRLSDPAAWGERAIGYFRHWPTVTHYSWCSIENKVRQFKNFWDAAWATLYNEPVTPRFPDVVTDEDVAREAERLRLQGGEHGPAYTFQLPSDLVPDLTSIPPPPWQGEVPPLASQTPWSDEMQRMMRDRIQGIG